jgi:hypothetical protein
MRRLAQSTAYTVIIKAFLDTDHVSAATGKTIAITLSKAGAAFGNPSAGATNATEVAGGWYKVDLSTTDTNTLGDLVVRGTNADIDDTEQVCQVVSATTGGATNLDAAVSTLATQASVDTIDDFLDTEIAAIKAKTDSLTFSTANRVDAQLFGAEANTLTASALAADAVTEIQSGLATAAALATVDDFLDTEIAAIKAKTDNLPADPADASDILGALTVIDDLLDTEIGAIKTVTDKLDDTLEDDGGTYRFTTNALEQGPVGSGLDAAGVRAAIGLASANLDTQLTAIDDFIDTEVSAIKAKTDNLPSDPADASVVAGLIAAVEAKIDTIDDFLDTEVAAIKAKTDALPTDPADASDIATAFSAVTTAIITIDDFLDTEIAAIKAKTDQITFTVANKIDANVTHVNGSASAAVNAESGFAGLVPGSCAAGSTTTSVVTNLTEATDDHYNGRVITFVSGALTGQTTSISDYTGATNTLTVVALTEAPADTDEFVIS